MKGLSKEETLRLISGRIMDEYRKHPTLDWSSIAATKIYSQWNEHYTDEIATLRKDLHAISFGAIEYVKEIELLKLDLKAAESVNEWISVDIDLPKQEQGFYGCFTFGKDGNRRHSQYNCLTKHFQTLNFDVIEVTHWMPLPTNPI